MGYKYKREWFHLDRYTGPWTRYKGKAYTPLEKASKEHDRAYSRMNNPMWVYSWADEVHRRKSKRIPGWKAKLAGKFWDFKKRVAPKATAANYKKGQMSRKRTFEDVYFSRDLPSNVKRLKQEQVGTKKSFRKSMAYGYKKGYVRSKTRRYKRKRSRSMRKAGPLLRLRKQVRKLQTKTRGLLAMPTRSWKSSYGEQFQSITGKKLIVARERPLGLYSYSDYNLLRNSTAQNTDNIISGDVADLWSRFEKFRIQGKLSLKLRNNHDATALVTVYEVKPRHSIDPSDLGAGHVLSPVRNIPYDENDEYSLVALQGGHEFTGRSQDINGVGEDEHTVVNNSNGYAKWVFCDDRYKLFDSPLFTKHYQVLKSKHFRLEVGQEADYYMKGKTVQLNGFDTEKTDNDSATATERFLIIQVKGTIISETSLQTDPDLDYTTNASMTWTQSSNIVNLAQAVVDVYATKEYTVKAVEDSRSKKINFMSSIEADEIVTEEPVAIAE